MAVILQTCSTSEPAIAEAITRVKKESRLQPATRVKTCQVCGSTFVYPEKASKATRFHCESCADLPAHFRKVLTRLGKRIQTLERKIKA